MKWLNLVCSISAICLPGYCAQAAELVPNGGFEELKQVDLLGRLDARTRSFYAGTADSPFQGWAFGGGVGRRQLFGGRLRPGPRRPALLPDHLP